jgi:hypothetical protein
MIRRFAERFCFYKSFFSEAQFAGMLNGAKIIANSHYAESRPAGRIALCVGLGLASRRCAKMQPNRRVDKAQPLPQLVHQVTLITLQNAVRLVDKERKCPAALCPSGFHSKTSLGACETAAQCEPEQSLEDAWFNDDVDTLRRYACTTRAAVSSILRMPRPVAAEIN